MRRLTLKELQQIELEILLAFDKICRDSDIKYSLGSGTMIGAVRHKGFIPWDDDIDIFMVRAEYEKFKKKVYRDRSIIKGKYKVLFPGDQRYPYPFIKIIDTDTLLYENDTVREELGVWIDIFPIDYCAQHKQEALKIVKSQLKLFKNYCRGRYQHKNNNMYDILKNLLWIPVFRVQRNSLKNKLITREREFSENHKMRYAGTIVWVSSLNDVYPAKYFDEYTEIEFENHTFMIFKKYNDILTHKYGNYMELPPPNKRISHAAEAYKK